MVDTQGPAGGRQHESVPPTPDIGPSLRARGMRMTPQRERVLEALRRLAHATPDAVAEAVGSDGGGAMSLSTVYRNLEALEQIGAVSHSHFDHRSPSYHLTAHANHLHLVCLGCDGVIESSMALADGFVTRIRKVHDFRADVRHMAIHGWCRDCAGERP